LFEKWGDMGVKMGEKGGLLKRGIRGNWGVGENTGGWCFHEKGVSHS